MKIKCILVFSFLLLFLLTSNISFSQDTTSVLFPKQTELKKGNYAIVFELGTLYGYTSFFEAYILTVKNHLSDNMAVRLSLGIKYSKYSGNGQVTIDQEIISTIGYNSPYYSFQTSLNLQYFPTIKPFVKPFISLGPYAEYYLNESSNLSSQISDYQKVESWGIGLFSSFGLEIFPFKNISFIGEYILKATWGKVLNKIITKDPYYNKTEETYNYSTKYNFQINTARMGFSVYF